VQGQELIYDLSSFFTRSEDINLAEKGYNKDHAHLKQINLALLCSAEEHLPTMIRALPGSVRDIKSIYYTMEEIGIHDRTLILDRGFYSEDVCDFLDERNVDYVLGTKRYSALYREPVQMDGFFMYQDRLIKCGRAKVGERWIYRFEDTEMRVDEEKNLHQLVLDGKLSREELAERLLKSGHVLILSSLDTVPERIYSLYKRRDAVEKMFDSYKNVLNADRTYLRDDASIFGHVFVAFLSLYIYCRLENLLRGAGLIDRLSPADVLLDFSKVYKVDTGERTMFSDVPKGVAELDRKLGTNIFPKP
jgi:transposase